MQIRRICFVPVLLLAAACQSEAPVAEGSSAFTEQALTPASVLEIETGYLVKGLSNTTYRDVASSSANYYMLTNTGIKRVAHGSAGSIPTAAQFKTINLNCIDYVNSTWNVVGARNKSGTTPAQLVLKIENSSPVTLSLPSDVTTVYDIEAKANSSTSLELWVLTNLSTSTVIREFRYDGSTLSAIRQIPRDTGSNTALTAKDTASLIGLKSNGGYRAFFKKNTTSPYASLVENQKIEIDHGPVAIPGVGDYSPGTTSAIYSHGYDGTSMGMSLYPDKVDWATYSNGASYYVMLNATGSGTFDLVELSDALVVFNKTPARDFNFWNDRGYVEGSNNCYNYAANRNTLNFAQPGYGSGQLPPSFKPSDLKAAAQRDGLEFVANPGPGVFPTVPEGKSLVALISGLAPNYTSDYHWFRRDRDGKWTGKPGACEATDLMWPYDDLTKTVVDPRTAAWDPTMYDTFVGFFLVDSNHEQGMGVENVNGPYIMKEQLDGCEIPHTLTSAASALAPAGELSAVAPLQVTILMYSGRENPKLVVTDAASVEAIRSAYANSRLLSSRAAGAKVGRSYMGLRVSNPCHLSGLPENFTLFNGQITAGATETALRAAPSSSSGAAQGGAPTAGEYRAELSGSLETLLLDRAEAGRAIDAATRERIRLLNGK